MPSFPTPVKRNDHSYQLIFKSTKTMATIQDRIRSIVASKLGIAEDEITPDKNLTNDLGADSLDVVELSMELEREFNLKFEDTDTEKIQTVEDLYKLIEEYTSK